MSGSYRVVDPLNRLRLRVRLRLIQDVRLAARDKQTQDDHDATGRVYELRWQERVRAAPRVGSAASRPRTKRRRARTTAMTAARNGPRTFEEAAPRLRLRRRRGLRPEEERSLVRDATGAVACYRTRSRHRARPSRRARRASASRRKKDGRRRPADGRRPGRATT